MIPRPLPKFRPGMDVKAEFAAWRRDALLWSVIPAAIGMVVMAGCVVYFILVLIQVDVSPE